MKIPRSVTGMRELYQELAAEPAPYIKRVLRVYRDRGFSDHIEVADDPNKKPNIRKYPGATRIEIIKTLVEITRGILYSPVIRGKLRYDLESFLNFKLDCDFALARTGSIDAAFFAWAGDIIPAIGSDKIIRMKDHMTELSKTQATEGLERKARGRQKKTNSADLMREYGHDPEAAHWIASNADKIDTANFETDAYRDSVLSNTVQLNELMDMANGVVRKAA